MIIPVVYQVHIFGDDSFDLSLTWRDEDGEIINVSLWAAEMLFYTSKSDRTLLKTVDNVPNNGTRIVLSDTAPNIYVFISADETGIGGGSKFASEPGYFLLRLDSDINDTFTNETDRLMQGRVIYQA